MVATVNILGVHVATLTLAQVVATLDQWIEAGDRRYVCCVSANGILAANRDPRVRNALNGAGLAVPDGMPLVWLIRRAGYPRQDRVYGPDLFLAVCARAQERGYSHFFYGGAPGVADRLVGKLKQRFPSLKVAGTHSPPFHSLSADEDRAEVEMINRTDPDIVWLGISTPKQDLWMAEHSRQLRAKVCVGVGAAFDFHAGQVKQAPRWMQRSGLEWAYRLSREPRRLWRRYLLGNPAFVALLALQFLGLRKYD